MAQFVLDCSVAVYWLIENGSVVDLAYAKKVKDSLLEHEAIVPKLWQLEMLNILITYERKNQLTLAGAVSLLGKLSALPIEVDPFFDHDILHLGIEFGLTAYDACYLSLALNRGLPLATLDQALAKAAKKVGVEIFLEQGKCQSRAKPGR